MLSQWGHATSMPTRPTGSILRLGAPPEPGGVFAGPVTRPADGDPAAVGIVIGGSVNDVTYMLPLKPGLDALRFELVSDYGWSE